MTKVIKCSRKEEELKSDKNPINWAEQRAIDCVEKVVKFEKIVRNAKLPDKERGAWNINSSHNHKFCKRGKEREVQIKAP